MKRLALVALCACSGGVPAWSEQGGEERAGVGRNYGRYEIDRPEAPAPTVTLAACRVLSGQGHDGEMYYATCSPLSYSGGATNIAWRRNRS